MLPNENQKELFYLLALSFVKDIGPISARALLARFENAHHIFNASSKELKGVEGIGDVRAATLHNKEVFIRAEKELLFCEQENITILPYHHPKYPKRLLNCIDAPLLLFYKGTTDLNTQKIVSIIGTRKNTDYGERCCELLRR